MLTMLVQIKYQIFLDLSDFFGLQKCCVNPTWFLAESDIKIFVNADMV